MLLGSNLVQKFRHDLEIMSELSEGALPLNSGETRGAVELLCRGCGDRSVFCTHSLPLERVPDLLLIAPCPQVPSSEA